jgi:hypothetical protein
MSSAALAGPPVVAATEAMTCRMRMVVSRVSGSYQKRPGTVTIKAA